MDVSVAIVGATGIVGRKIIELLEERDFPLNALTLLASQNSAGKSLTFKDAPHKVHAIDDFDFKTQDIVFIACEAHVAGKIAPKAARSGAMVFDLSSAHRMEKDVPLVVPSVNAEHIKRAPKRIVAGPNCVASPIATVLKPLQEKFPIKRLVITTYQSVSGAGKEALEELFNNTKSTYMNQPAAAKVFKKQIAFNVIPQIDEMLPNGITGEEGKIAMELKKLLGPEIGVSAHCTRVPVFIGHGTSLNIEFHNEFDVGAVKTLIKKNPSATLIDRKDEDYVITPVDVVGEDTVFVCRVRRDSSVEHGLNMWLCSDNLRRGAALDAVESAEYYLKHCH